MQTFDDWFRYGDDEDEARDKHKKALEEEARIARNRINEYAVYIPDFG